MQSCVVTVGAGCIRNAVAVSDPCILTLTLGASDALGQIGMLMEKKRLRFE